MAWQKASAGPRKDNSGAFKVNAKRDNPKQPHFKGGLTVNGREYWASMWIKDRNLGATELERVEAFVEWLGRKEVAFSVAIEPKDQEVEKFQKVATFNRQDAEDSKDFSDDIPF